METTTPSAYGAEVSRHASQNLRVAMLRAGIKNADLADRLGFSTGALWRRLSGSVDWSVSELAAAAREAGTSLDELLA